MGCPHTEALSRLQPPRLSQSVHREECTQCFDNQDSPGGIDVCLTCFNGGCLATDRQHAQNHVQKTGHRFTLNVKRKLKPSSKRATDEEPPTKMKKLAIVEERDEDRYDQAVVVKCWSCDAEKGLELPGAVDENPKVKALVDGVLHSLSSARQSEVKAWEEEILPCEHTLTLEQLETGHILQSGQAHCSNCDLKENLWLCLACGSLGCGRSQYGGTGGNGHGLEHYKTTGHAVSVKLGTITAEGDADVYCYSCDDAKQDPEVARHLATFGINIQTLSKTEKSMTELQIEQNLRYDFSLTGEDGQALEPIFGPGLTGLANLGNSCYMASVLQTIFSLPAFQRRNVQGKDHARECSVPLPAECVECQMRKVADGLLSGRYSHPANFMNGSPGGSPTASDRLQHPSPSPVFQKGIKPSGFKALVGKGHEEFSTMRQQDSEEFFGHLLSVVRRDGHKFRERVEWDATAVFSYALEQRLQCSECKKVRYRQDVNDSVSVGVPAKVVRTDEEGRVEYEPVELTACLDAVLGTEALDYSCPRCGKGVLALKQTKFASFPQVLVVHAKKFQLVNWVPTKLADIPILLPEGDVIEFTQKHFGSGLQDGEEEFEEGGDAAPTIPEFNQSALSALEAMGFPLVRCQKALLATGNGDNAELAMEWLFGHMDDADIDEPIDFGGNTSKSKGGKEPPQEQVALIVDMGFTSAQAKKALRETDGNAERAVEWLFNHPDDMGDELASSTASASSATPATPSLPGSTTVPAKYKLKAFISHKGPSVHSGHYVAHVRVGDGWVLFNDEKVVRADGESVRDLKRLAYLYVFERV
ncbi:ubiquitin carboxyl-terminal hydrolase 14 [Coprinopsis marcescibilis]|nr:ubiquitin carboxyl-terminal hydrolase 14 [Coprinopsis marcescibilis]